MVAEDDQLREAAGELAHVGVPGGAEGEAGDEAEVGGGAEEGQALLGLEPVVVVLEVVGEALEFEALGRLGQAGGGARGVVGRRPRAVHVGEAGDAVGVAPRRLGAVFVVAGIVVEVGADQHGPVDAVAVHLPQQLFHAAVALRVRHLRLVGPVLPGVGVAVDDHGFMPPWGISAKPPDGGRAS